MATPLIHSDDSYSRFAAETVLLRLKNLEKEMKGVRNSDDIERVHKLRVASRRLRTALRLFTDILPRKKADEWQAAVRKITKALGAARDTDVQILFLEEHLVNVTETSFKTGIERLLLRKKQERINLQKRALKALDKIESDDILTDIRKSLKPLVVKTDEIENLSQTWAARIFLQAYSSVSLLLTEVLEYEPFVRETKKIEEHHAMRIAAKHLRYTMEIFAPLYEDHLAGAIETTREIQDKLGRAHDLDIWISNLPKFLEEERRRTQKYFGHTKYFYRLIPGVEALLTTCKKERLSEFRAFQKFWTEVRSKQLWENLQIELQSKCELPSSVETVANP